MTCHYHVHTNYGGGGTVGTEMQEDANRETQRKGRLGNSGKDTGFATNFFFFG